MLIANTILFLIMIYLMQYFWKRRRIYIVSWQMNGPFAWPLIGNATIFTEIDKINSKITELCKVYDSPVRFWLFQKFIVFASRPEHIEALITAPETSDRGHVSTILVDTLDGDGLFTSRGEVWRHHRKCLNPTMHYKIVNTYYPIFNKCNKQLIVQLENKIGMGAFNIYDYLDKCSLTMICESLFGLEVDLETQTEFNILNAVNTLMETVGLKMYHPWYNLKWLFRLSKYYPQYKESQDGIRTFLDKLRETKEVEVRQRLLRKHNDGIESDADDAGIPKREIYIEHCLRLVDEKLLTYEEMIVETKTMLAGGFETTATAGSFIVLMMAMHPEYQETLFEEVKQIFPSNDSAVTAEDMHKMTYADRFIKETLRLFPVVPLVSRSALEDYQMGEYLIPADTEIILGIYYMQRNKKIWGPDADIFNPDNFLPERIKEMHPFSFLPFSGGPRFCIGIKYGSLVLKMFVAWLVRNYRFTTDLKMTDLKFRMDITLKLLNKHMVSIHRREKF